MKIFSVYKTKKIVNRMLGGRLPRKKFTAYNSWRLAQNKLSLPTENLTIILLSNLAQLKLTLFIHLSLLILVNLA